MNSSTTRLNGVMPVLCVPFGECGDIDVESLRRVIDFQLAWGVDGVVVFGLASESYKLTDDERRQALSIVVERVGGAVPVIAGTDHNSTEAAIARSVEAMNLGASAVMLYPPTFTKTDEAGLMHHFSSVARAVDAPVIVQDAPTWTGVTLSVDFLARLAAVAPNAGWVKVEATPAAVKMRQLCAAGLQVIGGYGALHIVEDLAAGASGIMPGCAMPGLYRQLWELFDQGDDERLWDSFTRALPLLTFQMSSLDVFIAVQKQLLAEIGVVTSVAVRAPGCELTAEQREWLAALTTRTGSRTWLAWPSVEPD